MKIIIFTLFMFLQHPGNPPNPPPGCNNSIPDVMNPNCKPDDVPLNGLVVLSIIGGIYGIKKLKNKKQ